MSAAFEWVKFQNRFREIAEAVGWAATPLTELPVGAVLAWEKPGNGPRVYLSAGIHGDEPAGPLALLALLSEGFFSTDFHWFLCPALNPTGLSVCTRENATGLDLNRDYWLRSSCEVASHAAWLDRLPIPDLFISLHEDWETEGFYFYEINLGEDRPQRASRILDAASEWFPAESGPVIDGHDVRENGWIYHAADPDVPEGWPEAIYLAKLGCPLSFTFETPSRAPLENRVAAHMAAIKAACAVVLDDRENSH
jgi:murein peptide amidase A